MAKKVDKNVFNRCMFDLNGKRKFKNYSTFDPYDSVAQLLPMAYKHQAVPSMSSAESYDDWIELIRKNLMVVYNNLHDYI